MTLSILIPSTTDRSLMLKDLLLEIYEQVSNCMANDEVEVLTEIDNKEISTGAKRNLLLQRAKGKYCVYVDSDDYIYPHYIREILKASDTDCDCMGINGIYTENGFKETRWFISKDNPYIASKDAEGKEIYLRYPNHITPIKTSIAKQFKFPEIYFGEDFIWATQIHNSKLIKTETTIQPPMYHYKFVSKK